MAKKSTKKTTKKSVKPKVKTSVKTKPAKSSSKKTDKKPVKTKTKKSVKPAVKKPVKPVKPQTKKPATPKPKKVVAQKTEKTSFDKELEKFSTIETPTNFFPLMVSITTAPGWAKGYIGRKYIEQRFADKTINELISDKLNGTLKTKKDLIKQAESLIENGKKTAEKEVRNTVGDTTISGDIGYGVRVAKHNDWDDEV
jgi:hypothetical protein